MDKIKPFQKILIANRGEIAVRLLHAIGELGYTSVLVHSDADAHSLPVHMADERYLLQGTEVSETYLDQDQILAIAQQAKVDAIHPGYGFLSENAEFAKRCTQAGLKFIGPNSEVIAELGDKVTAKQLAQKAGVPTIPGYQDKLPQGKKLEKIVDEIGYPLLIKAAAGGGGKGMRVVHGVEQLEDALHAAQREAQAYFGNDRVFLEKYIQDPRHIEVQILGDEHGNLIHLFERECSIQRRHQKMIEESPSPSIDEKVRQAMCDAALRLAKEVGYTSAGTIEFIVDAQNQFYFLEVNTRLQVEHPVTELVTGVDLVKAQLKIAEGHHLPLTQDQIVQRGHAIECRLYAEDPENDFLPSEGTTGLLHEPRRPGVRIESALQQGQDILSLYDPMLAKLNAYGISRKEALFKMDALLRDYILLGVKHNLDFLRFTLQEATFQSGKYHTHTVQEILPNFLKQREEIPPVAYAIGTLASRQVSRSKRSGAQAHSNPLEKLEGFRNV